MSKNPYNPSSHFFVDHTNLSNPVLANLVTDAFGPVEDANNTNRKQNEYRVTSFIRTATTSKVFAICDGHLLIQPNSDDSSKINLILRPSASYAPFKIKYFIYRGVNKSDLIDGNNLKDYETNSPDFLQK